MDFNNNFLNQILFHSIQNDQFLEKIRNVFDIETMKSRERKHLFKMVYDYFDEFKCAPKSNFYDLFTEEEKDMTDALYDKCLRLIGVLKDLSGSNAEYILSKINKAIVHFQLEEASIDFASLIKQGKYDDARAVVLQAMKPPEGLDQSYFDFFEDKEYIAERLKEHRYKMTTLIDGLDELIGGLNPTWLVTILGATKGGKCLSDLTAITLPNGVVKTIEEIVKEGGEDSCITYNECSKKLEKGAISEYYDNEFKECFEVITRTGRKISLTENHPLLTLEGWKELKDLSVNNQVAVPKRIPFFGEETIPEYELDSLAKSLSNDILCGDSDCSVPDIVFTLKEDSLSLFLEALFDYTGGGQINMYGLNEKTAYQLCHLLLRFGIISDVIIDSEDKSYSIEVIHKCIDCDSDILWDEIVSITSVGIRKVYDIEVPDTHNFIANDFVVHNSWWLGELAIAGVLQGLNVTFVSLEMNKTVVKERFDQAIGFMTSKQDGRGIDMMVRGGDNWEKGKGNADSIYDIQKVEKNTRRLKKISGGGLKIMAFNRGRLNYLDIKRVLDELEEREGYFTDLLVIDYLGIMKETVMGQSKKERISENCLGLKEICGEKNIIGITAMQGNRQAMQAKVFHSHMVADDIDTIFNSDLVMAICQTKREEEQGRYRLYISEYRHGPKGTSVGLVRDLNIGQIAVDTFEIEEETFIPAGSGVQTQNAGEAGTDY